MINLNPTKIGILSDTHDQVTQIEIAVGYFNRVGVDLVIHCGDWVSPFSLNYYKPLRAPIYSVFGNNDGDRMRHLSHVKTMGLNISYWDQILTIQIEKNKRRIAVYHGQEPEIVDALIKCKEYSIVFTGHNHLPNVKIIDDILILNPGSFLGFNENHKNNPTLGIYEVLTNKGYIVQLNQL